MYILSDVLSFLAEYFTPSGELIVAKFIAGLKTYPPKTKSKFKLFFHSVVRSRLHQAFLLVLCIIAPYLIIFGFSFNVEPFIILFFSSILILFLSTEIISRIVQAIPKKVLWGGFVVYILVLCLWCYHTDNPLRLIFSLSIFSISYYFKNTSITLSSFLSKYLPKLSEYKKQSLEAVQIIDLHRYCDLPHVSHFFDISKNVNIFLFLITVSSSFCAFIGITFLGKTYALCLFLLYQFINLFFKLYVLHGRTPSIPGVVLTTKELAVTAVVASVGFVSYLIESQPIVAKYSPKAGLGLAHLTHEEFPIVSGNDLLAKEHFNQVAETIIRLNPNLTRDPATNGFSLDLDAILEAEQKLKEGVLSQAQVEMDLYNRCVPRPPSFFTKEGSMLFWNTVIPKTFTDPVAVKEISQLLVK